MPTLKHLNSLDYLVVLIYLCTVAGVGIWMARYNRGTQDYFKAGGKLPWLISSLSLFVSGFSAYMFVAAAGFVYRNGLISVLVFTSAFGAYWLGFFIYGKLWSRARLDSPMQLLTRRFSQSTTYFYSLVAIVPNILLMGALLYTLAIFISSALGFGAFSLSLGWLSLTGFELTIIAIGAVVLLYTFLGGLWAVAVTDTIQFIILFLMTLVVGPLSFMYLGDGNFLLGAQNFLQNAPKEALSIDFGNVAPLFLVAFWFMNLMGYNANWHVGQRYYSVPDERDTRKMAAVCAIFSLVAPVLWIVPVLAARTIFPDMAAYWPELTEPTEASFVSLCLLLLPHGFLGVVVSAMLAASMSSADSTFNWLAAVITKDVYAPLRAKFRGAAPADQAQLLVGKLSVLVIGIVAILVSLSMYRFGSSFDIYLKIYSVTVPAMFMPVMLGFLYRKTPWWSAIAAATAAILCTLLVDAGANRIVGEPLTGLGDLFKEVRLSVFGARLGKYELNVFIGSVVSLTVFFLSSKWPNRNSADDARLAEFSRDLQRPMHGDRTAPKSEALSSYKIVGICSSIIGLLLIALSLLTEGFWINFTAGCGVILAGGLFWRLSGKYTSQSNRRG